MDSLDENTTKYNTQRVQVINMHEGNEIKKKPLDSDESTSGLPTFPAKFLTPISLLKRPFLGHVCYLNSHLLHNAESL
jgi:hypothetical protein